MEVSLWRAKVFVLWGGKKNQFVVRVSALIPGVWKEKSWSSVGSEKGDKWVYEWVYEGVYEWVFINWFINGFMKGFINGFL